MLELSICLFAEIPAATRQREEAVLSGDLTELKATLANLADQEREKRAAVTQLSLTLEAEQHLRDIQSDRVDMRQSLFDKSAGSRVDLIDAIQTLRSTEAQIAGDMGRKEQAEAALASLQSERQRTIETFLSDQTRKAADARRTMDEKRAEREKAEARLDHLTLKSPIDGTVTAMSLTTFGQVVTSGQEVMRIVPASGGDGAAIEIEAYVSNEDIGFIEPGQEAVIKIDSFPYTRYGTISGRVVRVAQDAIPVDQANQVLTDPTHGGDPASRALTPSARPMADLVFETRIRPDIQSLAVNGKSIALTPGMTVKVEIRTGTRKIIDYLFSPLVEVTSTAMRER